MRPISRETILDRRMPIMRWSAVFAGVAVSVSLWVLLQMLGMGIGLAAIDVDDVGSLRSVGIGTTLWTLIAPLVAMFVGGVIAGRLSGSRERRIGATHGLVVWSLTSLLGICAIVMLVSMLASGAVRAGAVAFEDQVAVQPTPQEVTTAADTTGKLLLGAGLSQLIALVTCVLGGAAGVRGDYARRRRDTVVTETVPPPPPPPTTPPRDLVEPPAPIP
jgi:MFS family permease